MDNYMTEDEKLILEARMIISAYKTYESNYFDTESYKQFKHTIIDHLPNNIIKKTTFTLYPKSQMLQDGKYVIEKHFSDFDLKVPYTDDDDLYSSVVAKFGKDPQPEQFDNIIKYINNQIKLIKITDIPVYLSRNNIRNGGAIFDYIYAYKKSELAEFYKKVPMFLREIQLNGDCDDLTIPIYVHEMSHALINRHKGNTKNLLNKEAFPIFMEKIAAIDLDPSGNLLEITNLSRILNNKIAVIDKELNEFNEINFSQTIDAKTYLLSSLYATALFDLYLNGSDKLRNDIDIDLGDVISGRGVLEDVLDYYEATPEKGAKIMKKQIKKYHNKYFK